MAGAEIIAMPGSTLSVEAVLHQALQKNENDGISSVIVLSFDQDGHFDVECSTLTYGDLALAALMFQGWVYQASREEPGDDPSDFLVD